MSTMVIASRELREKSRLLAVCAAAAVLPFLAALLPAARGQRPTVIGVVSGFLAIAFCLGTSIAQGASTIGRELSDRRLSFYFSKPVSPSAIWIGKAAASLLVSIACFAIVTVPAYLAFPSEWRTIWMMNGLLIPLVVLGSSIVLFFISHVMGTMIRSRSALVGLDFVLSAASILAVLLLARPLLLGVARNALISMAIALGIAFLAILVVAPVWQLAKGRTDVRQSHRALSTFIWTAMAAVLLIAAAYVLWIVSMSASSVSNVADFQQSPDGRWTFMTGTSSSRGDYHASFLIDNAGGRAQKVSAAPFWGSQFSGDGKVLAWVEPSTFIPSSSRMEIFARRLDTPDAKTIATKVRGPFGSDFVLSDDGSRMAIYLGRTVAVHDVATGRLLASAALDNRLRTRMFFASNDVVRIYGYQSGQTVTRLRISELDVARKSHTKTAELDIPVMGSLMVSGDGSRLILQRTNLVLDARTGATVLTLPEPAPVFASGLLRDGRLVVVKTEGGKAHVRFYGRGGEPLGDVVLPTKLGRLSGELSDGKVIVVGLDQLDGSPTGERRTMFVVDGKSIVRAVPNVKGPVPGWTFDPRLGQFDANGQLTAVDANGELVLWSPRTGETKKPG